MGSRFKPLLTLSVTLTLVDVLRALEDRFILAKNSFGQMDNSCAWNQMLNIVKCSDGCSDLRSTSRALRLDQTQAADRKTCGMWLTVIQIKCIQYSTLNYPTVIKMHSWLQGSAGGKKKTQFVKTNVKREKVHPWSAGCRLNFATLVHLSIILWQH